MDDNKLDALRVRPNEVAGLIYARTLPNNTLQLAISKWTETELSSRIMLPGKLYVPSEFATPLEEIEAARPKIKLRRMQLPGRPPSFSLSIEFRGPGCSSAAIGPSIEIDGIDLITDCLVNRLETMFISATDFERMRDGSEIVVKRRVGREIRRNVVGHLDKSSVIAPVN